MGDLSSYRGYRASQRAPWTRRAANRFRVLFNRFGTANNETLNFVTLLAGEKTRSDQRGFRKAKSQPWS
ncbi:MAG: hypothetical protein WBE29_02020, partial [Pseudolabrys sp.]